MYIYTHLHNYMGKFFPRSLEKEIIYLASLCRIIDCYFLHFLLVL